MAIFDFPLETLKTYRPAREEPADFDAFWAGTLAGAREHPLHARFERVDYGLRAQESYDVTFNGFGGQPIKAWLQLPAHRNGPVPCVVEYLGYGGGRGFPTDYLVWSSVGYAHLLMDTRGQGSVWQKGDTPDEGAGSYRWQVVVIDAASKQVTGPSSDIGSWDWAGGECAEPPSTPPTPLPEPTSEEPGPEP